MSNPIINSYGTKFWYKENLLHRKGGPAIEYANGDKEYYLNGVEYTEQEFKIYLREKKLKRVLCR